MYSLERTFFEHMSYKDTGRKFFDKSFYFYRLFKKRKTKLFFKILEFTHQYAIY
jgi:hypothetical protein